MPDERWRMMSSPHLHEPSWVRAISIGGFAIGALLAIVAGVIALVGGALDVDAGPVCAMIAITALLSVIGTNAVAGWWRRTEETRYILGEREEDPYPGPSPVPERAAILERDRRIMLQRIAAQRAARSQSAASGGSVSSTDAGRPSQGSSAATTEP